MLRRCICFIGAVCMTAGLALPAWAAPEGSVRIIPVWGKTPVAGGEISLCRVGIRTEEGLRITDGLANWVVEEGVLPAGEWIGWLNRTVHEQEIVSSVEEGSGAAFSGLKEGIYLIQQTVAAPDFAPFEPFLLSIPEGESWEISAEPKLIYTGESPKTGDHPAPIIGAMGLGLSAAILMVLVDERKK